MRDIVRHRVFDSTNDGARGFDESVASHRHQLLVRFAHREGSTLLGRFHRKYWGLSAAQAQALLLRGSNGRGSGWAIRSMR